MHLFTNLSIHVYYFFLVLRIITFIMKDDLGLPNTFSQSHILRLNIFSHPFFNITPYDKVMHDFLYLCRAVHRYMVPAPNRELLQEIPGNTVSILNGTAIGIS